MHKEEVIWALACAGVVGLVLYRLHRARPAVIDSGAPVETDAVRVSAELAPRGDSLKIETETGAGAGAVSLKGEATCRSC